MLHMCLHLHPHAPWPVHPSLPWPHPAAPPHHVVAAGQAPPCPGTTQTGASASICGHAHWVQAAALWHSFRHEEHGVGSMVHWRAAWGKHLGAGGGWDGQWRGPATCMYNRAAVLVGDKCGGAHRYIKAQVLGDVNRDERGTRDLGCMRVVAKSLK